MARAAAAVSASRGPVTSLLSSVSAWCEANVFANHRTRAALWQAVRVQQIIDARRIVSPTASIDQASYLPVPSLQISSVPLRWHAVVRQSLYRPLY